jgi:hypothetical protein
MTSMRPMLRSVSKTKTTARRQAQADLTGWAAVMAERLPPASGSVLFEWSTAQQAAWRGPYSAGGSKR